MTLAAVKAMPIRARLTGLGFMCVAMLTWAAIERIAGFFSQHYASYQIVWVRYGTHLLFMLAVLGPRYKTRLIRSRHLLLQLARAMMMLGMHLCFIWAVRRVPENDVVSVLWLSPLLLMVMALWLRERVRPVYWIVTLIAIAGMLMVLQPGRDTLSTSVVFSLGMGVCFSLYQLTTRLMPDESILASLFYTAFGVWVPLSLLMPSHWVTPTLPDLGLMVSIGLIGFVTLYALDRALELAPAPVVAPFALTQPVFVLIANLVLLGLVPTGLTLLGALIVVVSLLALAWLARGNSVTKSDSLA